MPRLNAMILVIFLGACTNHGGEKASLPPKAAEAKSEAKDQDKAPVADAKEAPAADAAKPAAPAPEAAKVEVHASPEADQATQYRLTGEVAAIRKSQIAFRVNGFISAVTAKPGSLAKKGDHLGALDDRDFVLRVELAKAKRDTAKIQVDEADKEYQRETQLKKENASTATSFDKIKAAYDQAKLGLKLAEIDLSNAELALKDTKLAAPYDCVVANQLKYDGENVQSGTAVLEIYDTAEPEISLAAPERLFNQIKVGTPLAVMVPSVGFSGEAQVVRLVPIISEKTRTFQVIAKLSGGGDKIVPGQYAEATVKGG